MAVQPILLRYLSARSNLRIIARMDPLGCLVMQDGLAAHLTEYPSMDCDVTIIEHQNSV